jgi:hypothetical protein
MNEVTGVYLLGGISLVSQIAFPELPQIRLEHATPYPVNILLDEVQDEWPNAVELDPDCFATPSQYFLRIRGVARYLVTEGREIVVCRDANAQLLDVRGYLLGIIFSVLCQQRGLLPLHASAVRGRDGVVAFLGRSGQGKSSLAAHLAQRGLPVVADDICLIDPGQPEEMMVLPTAPWLKLWRNTLQNLGREAEGLTRVFTEDDKYRLPLTQELTPSRIDRLMFLEESSAGVCFERVSAVEAVPLLMNLTHQAYLLQATGQRAESFLRCSRVASQAKAFRLQRPWGLEYLESTVDAVERFLLE